MTNYGTITATDGIGLYVSGGGTVTNFGTIGGTSAAIRFGDTPTTLKLEAGSSLSGLIDGGGSGTLVLEGTGSLSSDASDFFALKMEGTAWTMSDTAMATNTEITSGTLTETGTLLTATLQIGNGGTLRGTGTLTGVGDGTTSVSVLSGATVAPGIAGSPGGTLSINGNYTQQSGGTLSIDTTSSTASKLAVTGTATLGGALSVNSAVGDYTNFSALTILSATGGVTGTFSSVTDTNADLAPSVVYDTINDRVLLVLAVVPDLLYWDGGTVAQHGNGAIDGGSGTWSTTASNFTNATGTGSGVMHPVPGNVLFLGQPGTVTVGRHRRRGQHRQRGLPDQRLCGDGRGPDAGFGDDPRPGRRRQRGGRRMTATIASPLIGTGGLDKTGAGTLVLAGHNTYSGGTAVTAGTLVVNGSIVSAVSVGSGGTLTGGGTVGDVTVASGGTLKGLTGQTLTTGNLTLAQGSTTSATLGGSGHRAAVQRQWQPGAEWYARCRRRGQLRNGRLPDLRL